MNENKPSMESQQVHMPQNRVWGTIILNLVLLAIYTSTFVIIFQGAKTPSAYFTAFILALVIVAAISGLVLTLRGGLEGGIQLTYFPMLVAVSTLAILSRGVVVASTFSVLVISVVGFLWLFPRKDWRMYLIPSGLTLILVWVFELIQPAWRQPLDLTQAGLIGAAAFVLVFIVFLLRQAWTGNLRTKLVTLFITVTIVSVVAVAAIIILSLQGNLTNSIGENLASYSRAQAVQVAQVVNNEFNQLNTLALTRAVQARATEATEKNTLTQAEIKTLDAQWKAADAAANNNDPLVGRVLNDSLSLELRKYQGEFPENVEIFLTDLAGVSVATTARTSDYLQSDEAWWQTAYQTGQFIGEPEFDASSKTLAIIMAVAVRAEGDNRIVGILRTTVNINSLGAVLAAGRFGQTGRTDIALPANQVIQLAGSGTAANELTVIDSKLDIAALTQSSRQYQTISFDGVSNLASAAPVSLLSQAEKNNKVISDLGWSVVVRQEQTEALQPVTTQTRNAVVVSILTTLLAAAVAFFLAQLLAGPIVRLTAFAVKVAAGDLTVQAKVETKDEIGQLATTFNGMVSQLGSFIGTLEQRVETATRNLTLAAEVGHNASQEHDLNKLLSQAVDLIRERFGLYYTQVYLLDPTGRQLVLHAGTGTVAQQLISRRHTLAVDLTSLNGTAVVDKRAVIVENTESSTIHRLNPLLPDTRSEMVVPLIIGDRVAGTLDMQSSQAGGLSRENLPAFEVLAGQLAIAIDNATLLAETEAARSTVVMQSRRLIRAGWEDFLNAVDRGERIGYTFDQEKIINLTEPLASTEGENAVVVPIQISNEPVGAFKFEGKENWKQSETELVELVALQLGQQIENLRLLGQADHYRSEAETALRRLTHQGWEDQLAAEGKTQMGFSYDNNTVTPISTSIESSQGTTTHALEVMGVKIGEIAVSGMKDGDESVQEILNNVSQQLSDRVENLRLFEETERNQVELNKRASYLAAVADVSTAASRELDIQKMLETVVNLTQRKFNLYHAHVFILDQASQALSISACGWKEGDVHEGTHDTTTIALSNEQSLVARAGRSKQAVIVNDVHNEPGWLPNPLLPDTASEMAIPLVIGDQLLGVMDIQSAKLNAFTEEDANIQTTLSSQVATALQNARSFARAQQQAEREKVLNTIGQKIRSATSVEAVLQIAARELGHALGAPLTVAQLGMKNGH